VGSCSSGWVAVASDFLGQTFLWQGFCKDLNSVESWVELLFVVVIGRRILFASCFDSPTTLLLLQICVFWGMSVPPPLKE
jgi:hypothetical protein